MGRPLLTGSGVERAAICEASAVLPHTETISRDADRGSAIHAFLEAVNREGREKALAQVDDDVRPICEALDLSKLPTDPKMFAAEVAFAFDTVTLEARELGRGIGRRYDVRETEMAGTTDVASLLDADAVFVADYKSGWSQRPAARDSLQLRCYSVMAARAYKRTRAVVQMIRVMEDGTAWTDEATFDAFDLDSFALDLAAMASMIEAARKLYAEGVEPQIVEGDHCKWCPAFARCPAKSALLMGAPPAVEITPEGAAKAYERIHLHRQALDRAEEILKDYARANPIPLPNGMVYGVRYDDTRRIDGHVAAGLLRAIGLDAAVEEEVTQASIKRAIKGTTHKLDEILAAIETRGGLKTTKAPKLIAHKPRAA